MCRHVGWSGTRSFYVHDWFGDFPMIQFWVLFRRSQRIILNFFLEVLLDQLVFPVDKAGYWRSGSWFDVCMCFNCVLRATNVVLSHMQNISLTGHGFWWAFSDESATRLDTGDVANVLVYSSIAFWTSMKTAENVSSIIVKMRRLVHAWGDSRHLKRAHGAIAFAEHHTLISNENNVSTTFTKYKSIQDHLQQPNANI